MARRKGKTNAPASSSPVAAPPLSRASRADSSTARNNMRVAAAQRVLAATLPNVIYQERPKPVRSVRRSAPVLAPAVLDTPSAKRPEKTPREKRENLTVAKAPEKLGLCKSRPKNSRGSGGSRAFVPWCS